MYSLYTDKFELTVDDLSYEHNRCPKCGGYGYLEVQVYHQYPDGSEIDAGIDEVACVYCDGSGYLY